MHLVPHEIFVGLALVVSVTAAVIDLKTGQIPNWLTVGGLALGSLLRVALGARSGPEELRFALLMVISGVVLCSLVPLLLWRVARMGGGDLKLLVALGAICGPVTGFHAQAFAFMAMWLYVLGRLAYQGKLLAVLWRSIGLIFRRLRSKRGEVVPELMEPLRFGPAILAGVCLAFVFDGTLS